MLPGEARPCRWTGRTPLLHDGAIRSMRTDIYIWIGVIRSFAFASHVTLESSTSFYDSEIVRFGVIDANLYLEVSPLTMQRSCNLLKNFILRILFIQNPPSLPQCFKSRFLISFVSRPTSPPLYHSFWVVGQ